jgi:hypothetical protein
VLRRVFPWLTLLVLSVGFRAPVWLNAHELNSDVAIVGLQARHMLTGELSWFLWGSGYQSAVDSLWAAAWFRVFGATPTVLVLSALALHCALTCCMYGILRRHLPAAPWSAFLLACLLVFTTAAVHSYALYPPRQAALTLAVAALALLDCAPTVRRPWPVYAAGGLLVGLACFADPYARLLVPTTLVLGALSFTDLRAKWRHCALALAIGVVLGVIPDALLRNSSAASHTQLALTVDVVARNLDLLTSICGPWALGHGTYAPLAAGGYGLAPTPLMLHLAQVVASACWLLGCASSLLLARTASVPWPLRRLGLAGALGVFATFAAFLVSPMVSNHFSMRYLAAATLFSPLALAPLVYLARGKLTPVLVLIGLSTGYSGWCSFGTQVRIASAGASATRSAAEATAADDAQVIAYLRAAGVESAMADYWSAYRLAFVAAERPVVVPKNAAEDRWPWARARFRERRRVAYLYDARRSFEGEAGALRESEAIGAIISTRQIGFYTVRIIERR